jgi:hypothetical protein
MGKADDCAKKTIVLIYLRVGMPPAIFTSDFDR